MNAVIIFPNSLRICYREGIACLIDESKAKKSLFGGTYRYLRREKRKRHPFSLMTLKYDLKGFYSVSHWQPFNLETSDLPASTAVPLYSRLAGQGKYSILCIVFLQNSLIGKQKLEIAHLTMCSVKRAEILAKITKLNSQA